MRLSHHRLSDHCIQKERLGDLKRSSRSESCSTLEERVHALSPFPATYDVLNGQGVGFTEYSYTEFATGL